MTQSLVGMQSLETNCVLTTGPADQAGTRVLAPTFQRSTADVLGAPHTRSTSLQTFAGAIVPKNTLSIICLPSQTSLAFGNGQPSTADVFSERPCDASVSAL